MIDAAVVPSPRRPMASLSIHAGPDLGAVGERFAHAFVGDVEADRPGMWSAVAHEHPRSGLA
jgi:hypothetical protein